MSQSRTMGKPARTKRRLGNKGENEKKSFFEIEWKQSSDPVSVAAGGDMGGKNCLGNGGQGASGAGWQETSPSIRPVQTLVHDSAVKVAKHSKQKDTVWGRKSNRGSMQKGNGVGRSLGGIT